MSSIEEAAKLDTSLDEIFNAVSNAESISAEQVVNVFTLMLNNNKASDADIIATMQILIDQIPTEQHFDVWEKTHGSRKANVNDHTTYSDAGKFIMGRTVDSINDLPRNRRSESAYSVIVECGTDRDAFHAGAFKILLEYLPHDPAVFLNATAAMSNTEDDAIKKALLKHAINASGTPNEQFEYYDYIGAPLECLSLAQELKADELIEAALGKCVEAILKYPTEEQEEAQAKLLKEFGVNDSGKSNASEIITSVLEMIADARCAAEPCAVSAFVAKARGLGL